MRILVAAALSLALAAPAFAAAPEPKKPVDPARFTGRWYEQARLPSPYQKDCWGSTFDWDRKKDGSLDVVVSCRLGSPTGKAKVQRARATVLDPKTNAKLRVSFMGGLASAEYRVIDHGSGWVLMGTSGGNYLWVLSRTPNLSAAARDAAVARAKALGYNVSRFEYPRHG